MGTPLGLQYILDSYMEPLGDGDASNSLKLLDGRLARPNNSWGLLSRQLALPLAKCFVSAVARICGILHAT